MNRLLAKMYTYGMRQHQHIHILRQRMSRKELNQFEMRSTAVIIVIIVTNVHSDEYKILNCCKNDVNETAAATRSHRHQHHYISSSSTRHRSDIQNETLQQHADEHFAIEIELSRSLNKAHRR